MSAEMAKALLLAVLALLLMGCGAPEARYYLGTFGGSGELAELYHLLEREQDAESRFVLIQQIAHNLANAGRREAEVLFLTTHVAREPVDPFNGYYLLMAAQVYEELGETPLAVHYYARVLKDHQDLLVKGESVHLYCLQRLVAIESRAQERIGYYKDLSSPRFSGSIEHPGTLYFRLAQSYEEVGNWEQAIKAYNLFLGTADLEVPGVTNAGRVAAEKVLFYYADPTWTVSDLATLVEAVRDAIERKDIAKLRRYQARVNFSAEGWEQAAPSEEVPEEFAIGNYLAISNARVEGELDPTSNEREAWLRTTNWSFRPTTWYLYFRRIDFPAKPEVNGQWEWAGIKFGERLR
jgi:tetratricopeptide (TPR) repeat protein